MLTDEAEHTAVWTILTQPVTGRNRRCPCGSCRKYKLCCGAGVGELPAYTRAESSRAVERLMEMIHSPMFAGTRAAAQDEFFGRAFDSVTDEQIEAALANEQTGIAFNAWLMFDAYITNDGHRFMESILSEGLRSQFTAGQIRFLERMAPSHMRPYEIREVRRDAGFTLRDIWNDAEVTVAERAATHSLVTGETLFARVNAGPDGELEFNGALLPLMPTAMYDLLQRLRASFRAKLRKRPKLDEATFFKEAGPRIAQAWIARLTWRLPRLTTSDGQEVRPQTLVFDVVHQEALVRALLASDAFDTTEDDGEYLWLGPASKRLGLESTILGTLVMSGSRLKAQVMSDERAERLRALLDGIAPGALRFRLSKLADLSRAVSGNNDSGAGSGLPPELEAQVMQQFADRYYRGWLDEAIPALDGRTPRSAAKLKAQRAKVAALVREIERTPPGGIAVDLRWMWDELGLGDLR